jgi:hypothetical protein
MFILNTQSAVHCKKLKILRIKYAIYNMVLYTTRKYMHAATPRLS